MAGLFDWIGDALGMNKGKATAAAAAENKGIVTDYGNQASSIIDAGSQQAGGYLSDLLSLYGGADNTLYADALGFNGAEGAGRAQDAYTTSPGYQFTMDQGLQALDRRASAAGRFSSGNADLGAMNYASGLANQDWNNWLDRITGATAGAAGAIGGMADLATGTAAARADIAGNVASGLTSVNNQKAAGAEANQGWLIDPVIGLVDAFSGYNWGGGGAK